MLTVPRSFLRAVRALGRRCVAGRPRGPAPPLTLAPGPGGCVWAVHLPEVVLTGRSAGPAEPFDPVALPGDLLDAVDGPGDGPVTLAVAGRRAEVRWADAGWPRVERVVATTPGPRHALPPEPDVFAAVPAAFAAALHEAGRTAGRDPARFALHRVQVRGQAGDVMASDGVTLYWHAGFALPFPESVLVPAVPVFGRPEFAAAAAVEVGRTKGHLVVRAGPWAAHLTVDPAGRYPDVAAVVPRTPTPTAVELDPADAAVLRDGLPGLPGLPGRRDDRRPVTLDLVPGRPAVVRGRDDATGDTAELVLSRSRVANGPSRVAVDRAFLLRAVALGCTTIRVAGDNKPVVATVGGLTWLAAGLHPDTIVPAAAATVALEPAGPGRPSGPIPPSEDRIVTKPEHPGPARDRGDPADPGDLLAEADGLRSHLFDAYQAAGRLVALLKAKKKEQRALATVYSSLKSLNLGP